MMIRSLVLIILSSLAAQAQENIPIGTWRTHFGFRDAHSVATTENGAFCAGNNNLFFLDLQDNSLNRLSKVDGLSESLISTIAYDNNSSTLIVAYDNGTVDLLKDQTIVEIAAISQAPFSSSKRINHIAIHNGIAYLSAPFGVAVLDLEKQEIREAYTNIGQDGEAVQVAYSSVYQDSLFLATEEGVIAGWLDPSINLLDFTNWRRYTPAQGIPELPISAVAVFNGQVWASINSDGFYLYNGMDWARLDYDLSVSVNAMTAGGSDLLVTLPDNLLNFDKDLQNTTIADPLFGHPQMALNDSRGLWVADSVNGLVTSVSGSLTSVFPSGPFSDSLASIHYFDHTTIALPPGYDPLRRPLVTFLGMNQFRNGVWQSFNSSNEINTNTFPAVRDLVDFTFDGDRQRYYFASYGEGILEWSPQDGSFQLLDETSAGSTLINSSPGTRNVRVSSVYLGSDGTIWATNYGNPEPLHQYDPADGSWRSLNTPFIAARYPLDIQEADNGDFWLRLDPLNGGGILVIEPQSGLQKHLIDLDGLGGLPTRDVLDLAIDRDGQVWVGTKEGVVLFPFPFDILERNDVNASLVIIDGRPLLRDEAVNCIAVDGGNRKWMGTDSGLWLFSALGDSVIYNFTAENSPLPDNRIIDVSIDEESGEVFIITQGGLVSFRGTASTGRRQHNNVAIFPNPVTKDFNGTVGISGLTNNAIVKIADITGKLVTELRAQGGTAVWDVADFQGRRVSSGVYLLYSSSADGEETFIGKIAVMN